MSSGRGNDARAFRDFLDARLAGDPGVTLDECLQLWENEHAPPEDPAEVLEVIRRGLADLKAGRTRDAEGVLDGLCRKHDLPPSPR